jgi:hypothetical protein
MFPTIDKQEKDEIHKRRLNAEDEMNSTLSKVCTCAKIISCFE